MARRSLRPHLNQIRSWVRQGRTDAWIAHQLEVAVQQIEVFKRENELAPDGAVEGNGGDYDDEIDLRAEDDALIAAELDSMTDEDQEPVDEEADSEQAANGDEKAARPARRRGRRGGRGRKRSGPVALEGTFDHGEEGYGLWLDPAVQDDPIYAEHWAGQRAVVVTIEEEQILIRRAGSADGD